MARTEADALADVTARLLKRRKKGDTSAPVLTRDEATEAEANARMRNPPPFPASAL